MDSPCIQMVSMFEWSGIWMPFKYRTKKIWYLNDMYFLRHPSSKMALRIFSARIFPGCRNSNLEWHSKFENWTIHLSNSERALYSRPHVQNCRKSPELLSCLRHFHNQCLIFTPQSYYNNIEQWFPTFFISSPGSVFYIHFWPYMLDIT